MKNARQILKAIMVKLNMDIKLEQMKLADGVTIIEADVFEPEAEVFVVTEDDQRIPLPVGEYELESGMMLIVQAEGIIAEVKEMTPETEEEVVAEETGEMSQEPAQPQPKSIIESTSKEYKFEEMEAKIAELEAKIVELSKVEVEEVVELEATPEPIVFNPENKEQVEQVNPMLLTRQDRIFNIINND